MKTDRRESEVLSGILDYLEFRKDCLCWRVNVGSVMLRGFFVKFGLKGASDVLCIQAPAGQMVGIEAKREVGGRLSADQQRWGENLVRFGGLYIVARDVETVAQALGEEKAHVVKVVPPRRYPR